MKRFAGCLFSLGLVLAGTVGAEARTSNGNEFALYYSEGRSEAERKALLEEAKGRPHFFRYLQIMELERGMYKGAPAVKITAFEPSSYMDVRFIVTKRVSREKLMEAPETKKGDAIAVTGLVRDVDKNSIILGPVIVRHKDRLYPKRGKEMLYEVDESARFYSYTGGKREIAISYRDRDLLRYKDKVLKEKGPDGWVDFIEQELGKRNRARAAERRERIREQREMEGGKTKELTFP